MDRYPAFHFGYSPSGRIDLIQPVLGLEEELRFRLRGRRLVYEIGLDKPLMERLIGAMTKLRDANLASDRRHLSRQVPAITASYLVGEGIFRYRSGNFWGNLAVEGLDPHVLRQAFELAVRRLELETFAQLLEEEGAHRFIAPILAHGGIPQHSLGDFFRILVDELRRGGEDAADVLARWRASRSRFNHADRPVERFLLYGGAVSADLLERCIDLVRECPPDERSPDPEHFGLPPYVCEAYLAIEDQAKRLGVAGVGPSVPRPVIIIDPYSAGGPLVQLPAVTHEFRDGVWRVVSGQSAAQYRTSFEERLVPIPRAVTWSVELVDPWGNSVRTFPFSGLGRAGLLLFDMEDGRLLTDLGRIRRPRVWVLHADRGEIAAFKEGSLRPLSPVETAPRLAGDWTGFALTGVDLTGVSRLVLKVSDQGTDGEHSLWVHVRSGSIALEGDAVPAALSAAGLPVYDRLPNLRLPGFALREMPERWSARVEHEGGTLQVDGARLSSSGEHFLTDALGPKHIGAVRLYVRGPLGSDLRASFVVIPGLEVVRPTRVVLPGAAHATVAIGTADQPLTYAKVPAGTDTVVWETRGSNGEMVSIRVAVPCLHWGVVLGHADRGPLGQESIKLSGSDILDNETALLVVRTRKPGALLGLRLAAADGVVQEEVSRAAGEEGRWTFDLRRFADTIRTADQPVLSFRLEVDGTELEIGDVRSDLEVTSIRTHARAMPGYSHVDVEFAQRRSFPNRVVRLWPVSLPWRAPVVEPVAEGRCDVAFVRPTEELPPGHYLVEVSIDDGWFAPTRPVYRAPGTSELRIGTGWEQREWIESLSDVDPETVLAAAYVTGVVKRPLTEPEVEALTPAALQALAIDHEYNIAPQANAGSVEAVSRLLCPHPGALAGGVVAAVTAGAVPTGLPLLQISIDLSIRLARSHARCDADDVLDSLWDLSEPLAVMLDAPRLGEEGVRERIENYTGMQYDKLESCTLIPQADELWNMLDRPLEVLDMIRGASGLLPRRILDVETQAAAHLEWLIADRSHQINAARWVETYMSLGEQIHSLPDAVAVKFSQERMAQKWRERREMLFPETVFAAALHLVSGGTRATESAAALHEIAAQCPSLVRRALVLAALRIRSPSLPTPAFVEA